MIAPKRLSDGAQGERVGALLRSMRADAPASQSKARMIAALGLGAGLTGAAAEAGAVVKAAVTAKSAATVLPAFSLVKWIGLGVLLGSVSLVGLSRLGPSAPAASPPAARSAQPSPVVAAQRPVIAASPTASSGPAEPAAIDTAVERTPAAPQSAAKGSASAAAPVAAPEPAASIDALWNMNLETALGVSTADAAPELVQEVRALDRARAAIASGDGALALRTLNEYRAAFRHRQLDSEALMLQIQALVMTGDRAGAQALARSFVANNPRSPLVDRVRSLTGLDREEKSSPR